MFKWVGDRVWGLIDTAFGNIITGTFEKIKLKYLSEKIHELVQEEFLKKYETEDFFNSLDAFIDNNKIFGNFIKGSYNTTFKNYETSSKCSKRLCNNFLGNNPKFKKQKKSIENCIKDLLDIIFNTLNNITISNETRTIVNNTINHIDKKADEIIDAVVQNTNEIKNNTKQEVDRVIDNINKKII